MHCFLCIADCALCIVCCVLLVVLCALLAWVCFVICALPCIVDYIFLVNGCVAYTVGCSDCELCIIVGCGLWYVHYFALCIANWGGLCIVACSLFRV